MESRRLESDEEETAQLAALDELRERLAATETRLEELAGKLAGAHPDDVGRVQALAEDGLARASNAQAIAEATLERLVATEGNAVDALARADNAREAAGGAHERVVAAEACGVDALARADDAGRLAGKALRRATVAQSYAEDALATTQQARDQADDALQRAGSAGARAEDAEATARFALDSAREALLPARMAAFAAWLELRPPSDGGLISVVLPTRDRPALLPRAIESLLAQQYEYWEAIVVDDGEDGSAQQTLADVQDDRISIAEGARRGPDAARNVGLDRATGDVVCYLDDDNVMHPGWLCCIAQVFSTRPDVDVAYGVTVAEHRTPGGSDPTDWWPAFWQLPWSRERLLEQNLTDVGALAHRRDLPEARFEEGPATAEDWDLLIRLTADRPALAVPAISHAYSVGGDEHASSAASHQDALEAVRRRHAGERAG